MATGEAARGATRLPRRPRPAAVGGFSYIGLLLFIAMSGAALTGTGVVFHLQAQREREKQLLFVGDQYRRAIAEYYERSPGGDKRHPKALEDLLLDTRYPATRRYLRRLYRDPLGGGEWGLVPAADGGIAGVYSQAGGEPLKRAGFAADYEAFESASRYADWKFSHHPATQAQDRALPR